MTDHIRIGAENFDRYVLPWIEQGLSQKEAFEKLVARPGASEVPAASSGSTGGPGAPTSRQSAGTSLSGPSDEMDELKKENMRLKNENLRLRNDRMKSGMPISSRLKHDMAESERNGVKASWERGQWKTESDPYVSQQARGTGPFYCYEGECEGRSWSKEDDRDEHMRKSHAWGQREFEAVRGP